MVDEEFFEELLDVESELLQEYVLGRLSSDEKAKFGEYLRNLPDGANKLAAAFVLSEAAREQQTFALSSADPQPRPSLSGWQLFKQWLLGGAPVLRYASIAIVIALLGGIAYLVVAQKQLRKDFAQLSAERAKNEEEKTQLLRDAQAAQKQDSAQRDRIRELESQLAEERERKAREISKQDGSMSAALATLVLTPSLRSSGTAAVLSLSSSVKTVLLIAPVGNSEQIATYKAVLQTIEGRHVITEVGLRPQSFRGSRQVALRLNAVTLIADGYKLTLQGKAADGVDIAQDYYFNIVRK